MANASWNRRIFLSLVLVAGLSVLAFWSRSCLRPPVRKEPPAQPASSHAKKASPDERKTKPKNSAPEKSRADKPGPLVQSEALDEALLNPDPILRSMQFGRLFAEWYAKDSTAALAYLEKMPRGDEYNSALFKVLADIGQQDPGRALALARQLATNSEQRVVYNILFDQFAARNAQDAIDLLSHVPAGEARINAVRALTIRWTDQDIESALAWAQGLDDPDDRGPAIESVLSELSKNEPWRAFAVAVQNLDGDALERTVTLVFRQLKTIDPDKAGEFVRLLPPGETQTHVMLDLARAMADRKPAAALEWSGTLPSDELQQLALRNVLDVWLAAAPAEASDYVAKMPKGAAQDMAAAHLAENLAATDAPAAVDWIQGLKNASARQAASVGLASGWARQDPAAATHWAAGLKEDDPVRPDAMDAALSYWVLSDSSAAVRYVRKLSAGNIRDDGLDALSELLSAPQPALAVELAASIESPRLRNDALAQAFAEWSNRDPAAAQQWLANADLPASARNRLSGN